MFHCAKSKTDGLTKFEKRKKMKTVLFFVSLATMFVFSSNAIATPQKDAVREFNRGVRLFKNGKHEEAVTAFRKADKLKPSWKIKYNIGQCEAANKRYGLAIKALERYLGEGGDEVPSDRRDEVLLELERLRKMVGSIRVRGGSGVIVLVDKIERGITPMQSSILVTAGVEHWIWLVKDGKKLLTAKEIVSGGETIELNVPAQIATPVPVAPAPAPQPVLPPTPVEEPEEDLFESEPPPAEPEPTFVPEQQPPPPASAGPQDGGQNSGISPALFVVGLSGTVVFGALTGIMAGVAESKWDDASSSPYSSDANQDSIDSIRNLQIVGYISLALTGVALVTTIIAIPFTNWKGSGGKDVAVTLDPWGTENGGGLSLKGRF
jgi:hypothetical protein